MIEIKNVSTEAVEILTFIDPQAKGSRVKPVKLPPRRLEPGQSEFQMGYEPGVSIIVRPVVDPDRPRSGFPDSDAT